MSLRQPYLLFLGDAPDRLAAKVAIGVQAWRPEACIGQLSMPGCVADLGLAEMIPAQAVAAGAGTLLVGVANRGGVIAPGWVSVPDVWRVGRRSRELWSGSGSTPSLS
jgi:hypothetical protein